MKTKKETDEYLQEKVKNCFEVIAFISWVSEQSLSYSEIAEFSGFFETLGKKFNLTEEFKENGII